MDPHDAKEISGTGEAREPAPREAWTVERAQAALGEAGHHLLVASDALRLVYEGLPAPPDLEDRQEHRKPFDVATEVLATIECVLEDGLRPAIRSLERASRITGSELEREFLARGSRL